MVGASSVTADAVIVISDAEPYDLPSCAATSIATAKWVRLILAVLLGNWGSYADCPEDLDGNGEVGPFDLALWLGNWGLCE